VADKIEKQKTVDEHEIAPSQAPEFSPALEFSPAPEFSPVSEDALPEEAKEDMSEKEPEQEPKIVSDAVLEQEHRGTGSRPDSRAEIPASEIARHDSYQINHALEALATGKAILR